MSPKTIAQRTCSLEKKKVIYVNNEMIILVKIIILQHYPMSTD